MIFTPRPHRSRLSEFTQLSLSSMLEDINVGRIRLPYFHRNWCWPHDQILSFLESLGQGDPIGSLTFVPATGIGHRAFDGANQTIINRSPAHLVLDGQQRMTAAYQACFLASPVKIMTGFKYEHRLYFINMAEAVSSLSRLKDSIFSVFTNADGKQLRKVGIDHTDPLVQFQQGVFPTSAIFRYERYLLEYTAFWNRKNNAVKREEAMQILQDFRMTVLAAFESCKIQVNKLQRPEDNSTLSRVYEKLHLHS